MARLTDTLLRLRNFVRQSKMKTQSRLLFLFRFIVFFKHLFLQSLNYSIAYIVYCVHLFVITTFWKAFSCKFMQNVCKIKASMHWAPPSKACNYRQPHAYLWFILLFACLWIVKATATTLSSTHRGNNADKTATRIDNI